MHINKMKNYVSLFYNINNTRMIFVKIETMLEAKPTNKPKTGQSGFFYSFHLT